MQVRSLKNQAVITDKCFVAVRFFDRLRGLIGRKEFRPGEGILFPACNDIHMWFMSIAIDVVFLRRVREGVFQITSARANLRPWRPLPVRDGKASETLELPLGTIERCGLSEGDELCIG